MKYLLDTHILFWAVSNEKKLTKQVLSLINNIDNEIFFSSASVWEVVIKHRKNPNNMTVSGDEFVTACHNAGFVPLPIENHHILAINSLNRKDTEPPHNDPFDRLLIAQAKTEGMIFITHDGLLDGYAEKCVMLV